MLTFLSTPIDTPLAQFPALPIARSLSFNNIGEKGASALAAVLNDTKITSLKCAASPIFAFVSTPNDTPQHLPLFTRARSLGCNDLGPEGGAALVEGLKRNLTLQVLK